MRRRPVTSGTVSATDLEKGELRRAVRARLSALTPEELVQSDEALFARFLALPQVEEADTIFAFWGIPGKEPDTSRLIGELVRRGKVRRAKLYYLRDRVGKGAKLKEKL